MKMCSGDISFQNQKKETKRESIFCIKTIKIIRIVTCSTYNAQTIFLMILSAFVFKSLKQTL